jgi:tRNA A37 N6-isopentenylltransferase MiaA
VVERTWQLNDGDSDASYRFLVQSNWHPFGALPETLANYVKDAVDKERDSNDQRVKRVLEVIDYMGEDPYAHLQLATVLLAAGFIRQGQIKALALALAAQ